MVTLSVVSYFFLLLIRHEKLKVYIYTYLNIILIHNDHRTNKDHHVTDQHVDYDSSKRAVRHLQYHI